MRGFLKFLVLLPIALVLVLLGVANRQPLTLKLDPFASGTIFPSITMPLYVFFFATLAVGIIVGYLACWLAQGKHRKSVRVLRRDKEKISGEFERLKSQLPVNSSALLSRP